jgi:tape measure domain-containing protein
VGAKDISKTMSLRDGVTGTLERINAGTVRYKKTLKELKEVANETWSSIKTGVSMAAAATSAMATAAVALGIKANSSAEMAQKSFEILLKSHDGAIKMVADLQKLATDSPFEFVGLQEAAKTMLAMGIAGNKVVPMLYSIGDAVAASGGDTEQMKGIALAIGQIQTKGKLSAEEMNQLAERGIPAWSILAEEMGKTPAELMKLGEQGKLLSGQVLPLLIDGLNKHFGGSMKEMSSTFEYTISNIKETATLGLAGITKPLFNEIRNDLQKAQDFMSGNNFSAITDRISKGLVSVYNGAKAVAGAMFSIANFIITNWSNISPIVYGVVGSIVAYRLAVMAANTWNLITIASQRTLAWWTAFYGTAAASSGGKVGILTLAQHGLNAAMRANPIGFVITLLGLLYVAGTYIVQNWETVKLVGMNTWNTVVSAVQWAVNIMIDYGNEMLRAFQYVFKGIEFGGVSMWNGIVSAAEMGVSALLSPLNDIRQAVGMDAISVNFSAAKFNAVAPTWDNNFSPIPKVDFGKAKFSDDTIMAQIQKSKQEQDAKRANGLDKLITALDDNTAATENNTSSTDGNTAGVDGLNGTLKKGIAVDITAEQIADKLFPRLERHLYGT